MPDKPATFWIDAPRATALLRAVHRVRGGLGADDADVRRLTRALALAAGVPTEAAPWPDNRMLPDAGVLGPVREALTGTRVLRLEHLLQSGEMATFEVEPYHVRLEGGFWYLIAREAESGAEIVLRLDKVRSVEVGGPFTPRPVDLVRYLYGVYVQPEPGALAHVAFGPRSAPYANERWGPGEQLPDGRTKVTIPFEREHWLVRQLAEFGTDFEVLDPPSLRTAVADRARATLAAYERTQEGS